MNRLVNHLVTGWSSALLAILLVLGGAFDALAADASEPQLPASTSLKGLGASLHAPAAKPAAAKPGAKVKSAGSAKPAAAPNPATASAPAVANKPIVVAKPKVVTSSSAAPVVAKAAAQPGVPATAVGPVLPTRPEPAKAPAPSSNVKKSSPAFQSYRAPTQAKPFKQAKSQAGKVGKKAHTQLRGGSKRSKHRAAAVAATKPPVVKSVVVPAPAKVPAKPTSAAVVVKKVPANPDAAKAAPKGLAAKAPRDIAADKTSGEGAAAQDQDEDSGSGIWRVLMVFLLFTTASAGTFVYLKRRDASGSAARSEDSEGSEGSEDSDGSKFASETKADHDETIPASSDDGDTGLASPITAGPAPLFNSLTEPCPFDQYVEMQVAQACWAEQGIDLVSHLRTYFSVSMLEWSKISIYWKPRYLNSSELKQRFEQLEGDMKAKYGQAAS